MGALEEQPRVPTTAAAQEYTENKGGQRRSRVTASARRHRGQGPTGGDGRGRPAMGLMWVLQPAAAAPHAPAARTPPPPHERAVCVGSGDARVPAKVRRAPSDGVKAGVEHACGWWIGGPC